jgi:hypothetical protein
VLIATEGQRANDELHEIQNRQKQSEGDQGSLKQALERTLAADAERA